jgi:hypothetical protein
MNRIITLNDWNFWPDNARASVDAAAKRWDCEVIEVASLLGATDAFAAKFRLHQFCHPQGRALLLDSDIVIRSDCPSPFEVVPASHMAAIGNYQGDTHDGDPERHQRPSWDLACKAMGIDLPYSNQHYINGGFILFSAEHARIFRKLSHEIKDTSGVNEQGAFGVALATMPTAYLPREWNRIGPAVWESGPQMSAFIYHFANYMQYRGKANKADRINQTNWQL